MHLLIMCLINNRTPSSDNLTRKLVGPRRGFRKIAQFCLRALLGGYSYAWDDTCCIDKTSSAGLSEPVNLMYPWYKIYLQLATTIPPMYQVTHQAPSRKVVGSKEVGPYRSFRLDVQFWFTTQNWSMIEGKRFGFDFNPIVFIFCRSPDVTHMEGKPFELT